MAEGRWTEAAATPLEARAAKLLRDGNPVALAGPLTLPPPPAARGRGMTRWFVMGGVAVLLLSALGWERARVTPAAQLSVAVGSVVVPRLPPPPPPTTEPVPNEVPPVPVPVAAPRATVKAVVQAVDTSEDESGVLSEALTALNANDGAAAEAALRRYRARFPRGTLRREADVIHVRVLVLAGAKEEALRTFETLSGEPLPPMLMLTWASLARSEHGCDAARPVLEKIASAELSPNAQATLRTLATECGAAP